MSVMVLQALNFLYIVIRDILWFFVFSDRKDDMGRAETQPVGCVEREM
jgi:hypothetical protein